MTVTVKAWSLPRVANPNQVSDCGGGAIAISPDGKRIAISGPSGLQILNDIDQAIAFVEIEDCFDIDVAISRDGELVAGLCNDDSIVIANTQDGQLVQTLRMGGSPSGISFSPQDDLLAAITNNGKLVVWETQTFSEVARKILSKSSPGPHSTCRFTPNGQHLACAGCFGEIAIINTGNYAVVRRWQVPTAISIAFSRDGSAMATSHEDGLIRLWNWQKGSSQGVLILDESAVQRLALSPTGQTLASAGFDGVVRLWSVAHGRPFGDLLGKVEGALPRDVAFSPTGDRLYASRDVQGNLSLPDLLIFRIDRDRKGL